MTMSRKNRLRSVSTVLAILASVAPAAADTSTWAITGGPSATRFSPVTLGLTADTTGFSTSLAGFSAVISYDSAKLSFSSSSFGATVWPAAATDVVPFQSVVNDDPNGKVTIGVVADVDADAPNPTIAVGASQLFVSLTFTPDSGTNVCDATTLSFDVSSNDNNILTGINANSVDAGSGLTLTSLPLTILPAPGFVRGNANGSAVNGAATPGSVTLADPIYILNDLFSTGMSPPCLEAADANDDGRYNIVDAVTILQFVFGNIAVSIPPPFLVVGSDTDGDALNCAVLPTITCP